MSDAKKILMLAGDGVGPEVCKEATKIINAVTECYKFPINIEEEHSMVAPFNRTLFKHVSQLWRPGVIKDQINEETET